MSSSKSTEEVTELLFLEDRLKEVFNTTKWHLFTSSDTFVPIGIEIKSQLKELTNKVTKELIK